MVGGVFASLMVGLLPAVALAGPADAAVPAAVKGIDPAALAPLATAPVVLPVDRNPAALPTGPDGFPARKAGVPKGFDPALSVVDPAQTTETTLVYKNPDGSHTNKVSSEPVRFKDSTGWHDLDFSLVPGGQGRLRARSAAAGSATLPTDAAGSVTAPLGAGQVQVSHVGGRPGAAAAVVGVGALSGARTSQALGGGRAVEQVLTRSGFKDSVVLPDAQAGSSYQLSFTLPAGIIAKADSTQGVLFVDGKGVTVGGFGGGFATDSNAGPWGPGTETQVATVLAGQTGQVATVTVSVDAGWLADPARVFPVTIDPTYYNNTSSGGSGVDTWVSTAYANTSQWASTELRVGTGPSG
ncbi:MAG: laminin, partial [Frankiales bacterium]|nr:laminin [Frankiales bacterium]